MGTSAITPDDFITPPEFRALRLAADSAGRVGGVRLQFLADGERTRLGRCYQQVPLRVLPPFRPGDGNAALLYLLNPTAGLLDGDAQLVELTAESGSHALVVGQSANRIHPCPTGFSTQQWRVHVGAGATMVALPGPNIPFPGCRSYQRVEVDLDDGARFLWGDVWLAGRYARGVQSEWFRFDTLVQELLVRRNGRLVFRDRFGWRGSWAEETADWHFGGASACGSVFATGQTQLGSLEGESARGACFTTAAGDTCLRWLGSSEAVVRAVVAAVAAGADFRWLSDGALAPNHWFTSPFPPSGVPGGSGP
jgi:urease accessory protein